MITVKTPMGKIKMTRQERVLYIQNMHNAKKKMRNSLRLLGLPAFKQGFKEWNLIYEFSIVCEQEVIEPTKQKCLEWLYNAYVNKAHELLMPINPTRNYTSSEWSKVRRMVFNTYGYQCMKCGATDFLAVDHIKPYSIYPELSLDFDNLQVLCRPCNSSKSNRKIVDYRPIVVKKYNSL
jgi:hypothetical protein